MADRTMPNRFGGKCAKCRHPVAAMAGLAVLVGGKWSVEHAECPKLPSGQRADEFMSTHFGWGADWGMYGEYTGYGHDFGPEECNPNEGSK